MKGKAVRKELSKSLEALLHYNVANPGKHTEEQLRAMGKQQLFDVLTRVGNSWEAAAGGVLQEAQGPDRVHSVFQGPLGGEDGCVLRTTLLAP